SEVSRRRRQIERYDGKRRIVDMRELIDCRAAALEVRNHLRGNRSWVRRNALRANPVVAGEDQDVYAIQPRLRYTLPACKPASEFLEPAEGARRLRQFVLTRPRLGCRRL